MKTVIIQERIYARGKRIFDVEKEDIQWILSPGRDAKAITYLQQKHHAMAVVIDSRPFAKSFFEGLKEGSLVARFGTGYNNVPMDVCMKKNLFVANTPKAIYESAVEYLVGLTISLNRGLHKSHNEVISGKWIREEGTDLRGRTLGIIGFGAVGRELARVMRVAFGMKVLAYGRSPLPEAEASALRKLYVDAYHYDEVGQRHALYHLLKQCDIVSLNVPYTERTRHMIDEDALKQMKRGSLLVNTSRGGVIEEDALYEAIQRKHLRGAALDVFVKEPYEPSGKHDLRTCHNLILTPHLTSHSEMANTHMAQMTVENIKYFYAGSYERMHLVKECKTSLVNEVS